MSDYTGLIAELDEGCNPADALREHDAALIESLADGVDLPGSTAAGYYGSEQVAGYREAERDIEAWLRERARQVREGEA